MSILTTFFNLIKPEKTETVKVSDFNSNMDTIDSEMHKPPLTINGISPDSATRNLTLTEVPLAGNLSSDIAQVVVGTFIERMSGGDASIEDGAAFLTSIKGNMVHTGYSPEELDMSVNNVGDDGHLTATLDRDTFVSYVESSGTITLSFTTSWSADPTLYGVTVTGTPVSGDQIVIVYVAEERGTITVATPTTFVATGWNLYDNTVGRAKVIRYSSEYGYKLGGSYSLVEFAETIAGSRTSVTLEDGLFNVPSDGYIFVTGGNATTYIYPTWSDWTDTYEGNFKSYSTNVIDLTEIMASAFEDGMFAIGETRDEINFNTKQTIQRIERLAYSASNLADVIDSGVPYEYDTNYIYAVLETPVTATITEDGEYTVDDHGIEYFTGTDIPVVTEVLYGENLKDKLRTDVLTISAQTLSASQKSQVLTNIGAASASKVAKTIVSYTYSYTITASGNLSITATNLGLNSPPNGYTPVALAVYNTGNVNVIVRGINAVDTTGSHNVVWLHNLATSQQTGTMSMSVLYLKF